MRILSHIAAATAAGILAVLGAGFANVAHAETHIGGLVTSDVHFTLADSPVYLTAELAVQDGHTVTVDPGVIIDADPRAQYSGFDIERSGLIIKGTPEQPVVIRNIKRIYTNWSTVDISHADIHTEGSALQLYNSSSTLDHIFIDGEISPPIYSVNSALSISDSRFTNNRFIGIYIAPGANSRGPVRVHNSSITGNGNNALMNASMITVEAENNWWGTPEGPSTTGENSVVGYVHTSPWLTEPPLALEPPQGQLKTCCSSVLFIPGLQGTRLYDSIDWPLGLGSKPYKDWEPVWNGDVKNLYLDQTGSSTKNVYSTDPIDTVFGMTDIYGKFMDFLGSLVSGGEIQEWRAFGYDWRKPIAEVVAGPERKSTTTESLIETVTRMASSSKTGKVSIVAHSNGGLIAKYLVKTLADLGKSSLIDQVISVAVPYLGTPEAIAGLLHGDHQSIAYGLIASASVARGLGENMASAYGLIPSTAYLAKGLGPTIVFASTTSLNQNDAYPSAIKYPIEQANFITDVDNLRTAPMPTDVATPIRGNRMLYLAADAIHSALDTFIWPANILRYAVVGIGADTTRAISYADRYSCLIGYIGLPCHPAVTHTLLTTKDGDGTVVASSAAYESGTTTYVDMQRISDDEGRTLRHANILESSTTESVIGNLLMKHALPSALPNGTSLAAQSSGSRSLVISTHSPVHLDVYDQAGRHTGLREKPVVLKDNSFITGAFEEQIPGSSFEMHDAEDGYESTIHLPDVAGTYRIRMTGTDLGFATLDIEKTDGLAVTSSVEYSMFPVTPFADASTTLEYNPDISLDDPGHTLSVDLGNGTVQVVTPNRGALSSPTAALEVIKAFVRVSGADDPHVTQLVSRLDHLEDLITKGKLKQASNQAGSFATHLGHIDLKTLTDEQRQQILSSIDAGLKTIEDAQ